MMPGEPFGQQPIDPQHEQTQSGAPAGGVTIGPGLRINWADCAPETVIAALADRLRFLQVTTDRNKCNDEAIHALGEVQSWLTQKRQGRS